MDGRICSILGVFFWGDQLGVFDLFDGLGNPKVCLPWSKDMVVVGPVVGGFLYS